MEFREAEDEEAQKSIEKRVDFYDEILSSNLRDISKLEGQRDEIKISFASDLSEIQKFHAKGIQIIAQKSKFIFFQSVEITKLAAHAVHVTLLLTSWI